MLSKKNSLKFCHSCKKNSFQLILISYLKESNKIIVDCLPHDNVDHLHDDLSQTVEEINHHLGLFTHCTNNDTKSCTEANNTCKQHTNTIYLLWEKINNSWKTSIMYIIKQKSIFNASNKRKINNTWTKIKNACNKTKQLQ